MLQGVSRAASFFLAAPIVTNFDQPKRLIALDVSGLLMFLQIHIFTNSKVIQADVCFIR